MSNFDYKTLSYNLLLQYNRRTPLVIIAETPLISRYIFTSLQFYLPDTALFHFCDREILPYDQYSPQADLAAARMRSLSEVSRLNSNFILITDAQAISERLCPRAHPDRYGINLAVGDELEPEKFAERLVLAGYNSSVFIAEKGDFSRRGGSIIDLYPLGAKTPYRIEFFDTEVASIRSFELETQTTIEKLNAVKILPNSEIDLSDAGRICFRQNARAIFGEKILETGIYQQISAGRAVQGLDCYLPLFFDETASIFDYLPKNIEILGNISTEILQKHWDYCSKRYERLNPFRENALLPPEKLWFSPEEILEKITEFKPFQIKEKTSPLSFIGKKEERQKRALQEIAKNPAANFYFSGKGEREQFFEFLHKNNISAEISEKFSLDTDKTRLFVAPLKFSFYDEQNRANIAFAELSDEITTAQNRAQKRKAAAAIIASLQELNVGDAVVHSDFGVGRYRGLERIAEDEDEMLVIEYAKGAKLFVSIGNLDLISKYGGDPDSAPLNELGGKSWANTKKKIKEKIKDTAAELLALYAAREAATGYKIEYDEAAMQELKNSFAYTETPDQQAAIEAVLYDLSQEKPMDRIICGDVGFGKTEVAIRAAYATVLSGRQVALISPTTLLAEQHFHSFADRLLEFGLRIESLSRFRSAAAQKATIAALKNGSCDLVIGTHRLLQKDVEFKRLGLVIIDEEQRFGVKHKEKLKTLRNDVNLLALSATPIPRTMNLALAGLRDLSLIATAPQGRQSVQTSIHDWDIGIIEEACEREIRRGGQVFVLHNDVKTIERISRLISEVLPLARVAFAHGQMSEKALEQVMQAFYNHHYDILVATTIIESGIDIPNANTIIINRADKLGLAQLHQLRGRVGRSNHQAYAYLITPPPATLNKDAQRRLEAFVATDSLGAGFILAGQDLEIRGAGKILGEEQSGQVAEIGMSYYLELLDRATYALKNGENLGNIGEKENCEIDLSIAAHIPDNYLADPQKRLTIYQKLARAKDFEEIATVEKNLIDSYGEIAKFEAIGNLIAQTKLKVLAEDIGVKKISTGHNASIIEIEFRQKNQVAPKKLSAMLQKNPRKFAFVNPTVISVKIEKNGAEKIEEVCDILNAMV